MKTVSFPDFLNQQAFFLEQAQQGKIFVYPTDTIYGIGAMVNPKSIFQIYKAKQRQDNKHYSIIAPSFTWIKTYFKNTGDIETQQKQRQFQFPWRGVTILLEPNAQYKEQAKLLSWNNLIGVRLIQHPFQNFVKKLWQAFITTSANLSWQKNITHINDIAEQMKQDIDYIIDDGTHDGKASVVINGKTGEVLRE